MRKSQRLIEKIRELQKNGCRSFEVEAKLASALGFPGSDVYIYFPSMENRFKNLLMEHGFLVDYVLTVVDPESRATLCRIVSELKKCT